jgi:hypothetical protein
MATLGSRSKHANARSASRRAQFQLWIFSYTTLVGPSKKCVSRVWIDFYWSCSECARVMILTRHSGTSFKPDSDYLAALVITRRAQPIWPPASRRSQLSSRK